MDDLDTYDRLVILSGAGRGTVAVIPRDGLVIGRQEESGLVLSSMQVSRRHALVSLEDGHVTIIDLDSRNGVWVNGRRRSGAQLSDGDLLQLGDVTLRFRRGVRAAPVSPRPADGHAPGAGRPAERTQPLETKRQPPPPAGDRATPWYLHGKTLVIGAGALASAVLGIWSLWDRLAPQDVTDVANIESVQIAKQTSLGDFAAEDIGGDLFLRPAPEAAAGQRVRLSMAWAHAPDDASTSAFPAGPAAATTTSAPTPSQDGTEAPSPSPNETSVPVPEPSPTPTPSPSPTPSPTTSAEESPGESPDPVRGTPLTEYSTNLGPIPRFPSNDFVNAVEQDPALDGLKPRAIQATQWLITSSSSDAAGEPLPPEEAAKTLAEALADVEPQVPSPEGGSGPEGTSSPTGTGDIDPLGWTVVVRVSLDGLDDVPFLLTWSLDGVDVSETWRAENLAYRVIATTPSDAGVAQIWVPNLKTSERYNVNVRLSYESNGLIAAHGVLPLPED